MLEKLRLKKPVPRGKNTFCNCDVGIRPTNSLLAIKMTGETLEVRSDKNKKQRKERKGKKKRKTREKERNERNIGKTREKEREKERKS